MKALTEMTPHELGESANIEALPYLIHYLESGSQDEKKLAASAVQKLSRDCKEECNQAIPALLTCLREDVPQTRHSAIKALERLDLPIEAVRSIQKLAKTDEKAYNRIAALDIIITLEKRGVSLAEARSDSPPQKIQTIPEKTTKHSDETRPGWEWWQQLDESWKEIFKKAIGIDREPAEHDLINILSLQEVDCKNTEIHDLKPLRKLKDLRSLNCIATPIKSLSPLRQLTGLLKLRCSRTQIRDIEPLKKLRNLQELLCRNTPINSLVPLRSLKDLRILNISSTQVSSLEPLRHLSMLKLLHVRYTPVSDVSPLQNLSMLSKLYCKGTEIEDGELDLFRRNHPDCEVFHGKHATVEEPSDEQAPKPSLKKQPYVEHSLHPLPAISFASKFRKTSEESFPSSAPIAEEYASNSLNVQLQAGYFLEGVKECLHQSAQTPTNTQALLHALSYFELETNSPLFGKRPQADPLVAVINNLITRGLPTKTSVYIEEMFAKAFQFIDKEIDTVGSIHYRWKGGSPSAEDLYNALHIIDPRISIGHLSPRLHRSWEQLGSRFEEQFFSDDIPRHLGEYLLQVLEPQRSLPSIVGHRADFTRQRVDFALQFPYPINEKKGCIIEIDGPQHDKHNDPKQYALDIARDQAAEEAGWERTVRIKTRDFQQLASRLYRLKNILRNEYCTRLSQNYTTPLFRTTQGLQALQLALTPFAIARIQKTLLELIVCGVLDLNAERWNVIFVERDVPCAALAIEDLKQHFEQLFFLENKDRKLPHIQAQIFASDEFLGADLHQLSSGRIRPLSRLEELEDDGAEYDALIDISVLQRKGTRERMPAINCRHRLTIRSAHAPKSQRRFYTSDVLAYRPLARRHNDGSYELLREPAKALTYFLQNIFRKEQFRPGQLEILNRALQAKSVIGLLPTGGGKSLTYQLAALLQPGITLVIDPLKSLMKDQYENLSKNSIDASVYVNSSLTAEQKGRATKRLSGGEVLFAFVSPERLQIQGFRETLLAMYRQQLYFSYCVIDEVHCVSEWGHDFRTSYLKLGENAMAFCKTKNTPTIPLFGLTATASFDVLSDVQRELSGKTEGGRLGEDAVIRFETSNRDELQFEIIPVEPQPLTKIGTQWDVKQALGLAKHEALHSILHTVPDKLAQYNADPQHAGRALDNLDVNNFFHEAGTHAGIVFCPHRSWFFGVTDQYKSRTKGFKGVYDSILDLQSLQEDAAQAAQSSEELTDAESKSDTLIARDENANDTTSNLRNIRQAKVGLFMGSGDDEQSGQIEADSIRCQEEFINNQLNLLVATKAFGMGIDKPNIRFTVHINYPSSLESFVQEAGRAGRDRKLSVCYLLFNGQEFSIDTGTIDIDKDILQHFHRMSFRGTEKEKAIIDDLLYEISYPRILRAETISDSIAAELETAIVLRPWKDRVYVNDEARGSYGYIDLRGLEYDMRRSSYPREVSETILDGVKRYLLEEAPHSPDERKAWLQTLIERDTEPGIERRLEDIDIGEELNPPIYVQFTNDRDEINEKVLHFFEQLKVEDSELQTIEAFSEQFRTAPDCEIPESIHSLLERHDAEIDQDPGTSFRELRNLLHGVRYQADTEKALYRLFTLGIIDDYTVDYNANTYVLYATKKSDEEYKQHLHSYINTYYSDIRAREEIQRIDDYEGQSTIQQCLYFLIDFVYQEIAKKRLEAINTMKLACYEGIGDDGNAKFKSFIDMYFNSKYARAEHLPADTDHGKEFDLQVVWKYMEFISEDKSGSQIDNLKHLRGACLRLLTENPDNASFLLLKAFALIILEPDDERLLDEAQESLLKGFTIIQDRFQLSEESLLREIERYKEYLHRYTGHTASHETMEYLINVISLNRHTRWLEQFSKYFLEGYEKYYS